MLILPDVVKGLRCQPKAAALSTENTACSQGPLGAGGAYAITHRPATGLSPSNTVDLLAFPYHLRLLPFP